MPAGVVLDASRNLANSATRYPSPDSLPVQRERGGALARIANDADHLQEIVRLGAVTDDRHLAESDRLHGVGVDELVFGVPYAHIVNAAFAYAHPLGGRFNGPGRGTWYAGIALETAQTEVAWRKSVELAEIGGWRESLLFDDYLADFAGSYHDIRDAPAFADCLDARSYRASQTLAAQLLDAGSGGIVYPSVRHTGGVCIACFRPALVHHVRQDARYRFSWDHSDAPPSIDPVG